jgi:hypothetical protein
MRRGPARTWRSSEVDKDKDEQCSSEVDEGMRAADLGNGEDEDVEAVVSVCRAQMGELRGPAMMETMRGRQWQRRCGSWANGNNMEGGEEGEAVI